MIYELQGPFVYSETAIKSWNTAAIGVYYCGYLHPQTRDHYSHYIGKGTGDGGVRERVLCHIREDNWPDITHVMVRFCDTAAEAESLEAQEIARCKPRYNKVGW